MKAVVLLSGGMDSAAVLYEAIARHGVASVCALSFDYGQRHASEELVRAESIAAAAGVALTRQRFDLGVFSALTSKSASIITDPRNAVVPFRNSYFALRAATHALACGASEIWMGCCAADAEAFPDCRPAWAASMSATLSTGGAPGVHIVAPFIDRTKAQIVRRSGELGHACAAAVKASWSCYCPVLGQPCGECSACRARARGFAEASCCQ